MERRIDRWIVRGRDQARRAVSAPERNGSAHRPWKARRSLLGEGAATAFRIVGRNIPGSRCKFALRRRELLERAHPRNRSGSFVRAKPAGWGAAAMVGGQLIHGGPGSSGGSSTQVQIKNPTRRLLCASTFRRGNVRPDRAIDRGPHEGRGQRPTSHRSSGTEAELREGNEWKGRRGDFAAMDQIACGVANSRAGAGGDAVDRGR